MIIIIMTTRGINSIELGTLSGTAQKSAVVSPVDGSSASSSLDRRETSFGGAPRDASKLPERHATWQRVSFLLIADIVGVGILELGYRIHELGWILGIFFLTAFFVVNMYTALLMSRLRDAFPLSVTYGDLAGYVMDSPKWAMLVWGAVYTNLSMSLASYLLVIAKTLEGIFYGSSGSWCDPFVSLVAALLLIPLNQIRSMHGMSYLAIVSFITIALSVALILGKVGTLDRTDVVTTAGTSPGLDFWGFFGAMSGFIFAYAGQSIYMEFMAEMVTPTKFPKSLSVGAPSIYLLYLISSTIQYSFTGQNTVSYMPDALPNDAIKVIANVSLLIHMLISYNITNQVLTRAIHVKLFPRTANASTCTARLHWFFISLGFLFLSWIVSNAVPFFDNLTGIIGALLLSPISLMFPCFFYLQADRKGTLVTASGDKRTLSATEKTAQVAIIAFGAFVWIVGTIANIRDASNKSNNDATPFSCNVLK